MADAPSPPPQPRAAAASPRRRAPRPLLPLVALLVGLLGIAFSVDPSLLPASLRVSDCPAAVQLWRSSWGVDGAFAWVRRLTGGGSGGASGRGGGGRDANGRAAVDDEDDGGAVDDDPETLEARGRAASLAPRAAPAEPRGVDPASGLPLWRAADVARYTGRAARRLRVLLGVCGDVYDVTVLGYKFYGPGAGYALFAGRDATRALALGSTSDADVARAGDVTGVAAADVETQCTFYRGKYELVGKLVAEARSDGAGTAADAAEGAAAGAAAEAAVGAAGEVGGTDAAAEAATLA